MLSTACSFFFFFNDTATTEIYTLSLHDALPISQPRYTNGETKAVYAESRRRLDAALAAGRRVIFDATNLREHRRALLYAVGEQAGLVTVVRAYAPDEVVRARVIRRFAEPDPLDQSDADWRISRLLQSGADPIRYPHLVVNTTVSPAPSLRLLGRILP